MEDMPLRAMGIGHHSIESDEHAGIAAHDDITYRCPVGHRLTIHFSVLAEEIPGTWACRCGRDAVIETPTQKVAAPVLVLERRSPRSHWDMLRERRSIPELETLLAERLALLHPEHEQLPLSA